MVQTQLTGALYFYNPKTAKSKWLFSLKTVATIGNHVFAVSPKAR